MTEYKVLSAIRHDGEDFEEGDLIKLSADAARPLLDMGVIGENPARPTDDQARLDEIADAIRGLDRDNPELWTNSGKPQVSAIEAVLGYDISASERDAALEMVEA